MDMTQPARLARLTLDEVNHQFTYHPPSAEQIPIYNTLRDAAKEFATVIFSLTPPGPDQTAAIRKVREAVMTANAAIALGKKD